MWIVNFAHPLTAAQLTTVERLTGQAIDRVLDVKTHFDHAESFTEQAKTLMESVGLSPQEWQTTPLLVNVPSLNVIAALILAELHGRMGYFPAVLRFRPVALPAGLPTGQAGRQGGSAPPQFEVAEIVNVQQVRERARQTR